MKHDQDKLPSPPTKFLAFLRWYCRQDALEEIEGDLIEIFKKNYKLSPKMAKARFRWNVIRHFRPAFIKKISFPQQLNTVAMIQSHFRIGWRSLISNKFYSLVKIGGFAIGIAACMLIGLFIQQELNYDTHLDNADQIYRVVRETTFNGESDSGAHFPAPFAATLSENFPEIELAGRLNGSVFFGAGSNEVRRMDRASSHHEEQIVFVDHALLTILQAKFLQGNPKQALNEPNTIVITNSVKKKYFQQNDVLGQILVLNNDESSPYRISGVVADFPKTSHFKADFMISLANKEFYDGEAANWQNDNYQTYIKLNKNAKSSELAEKLLSLKDQYFLPPRIETGRVDDIAWVIVSNFIYNP